VRAWALGLAPVLLLVLVAGVAVVRGRLSSVGVSTARPGPILLVSGYGGSTSSLQLMAGRLRATGRQVLVVPPVGDNTGDLLEQARVLDRVARQQVDAGTVSVDVVGYSAGGVVARIWAAELGGAALARRVVTLGSPHHGTDVALLASGLLAAGCPTACRQLAPSGELVRGLPDTPSGPRWTSVWTADDDVVLPPGSARLSGAVDVELQQVCRDARVSHGQLPTDPLTIGLVLRALDGAGLGAAPAPSECAALRADGGRADGGRAVSS
jgi:triacylglycerol lipase